MEKNPVLSTLLALTGTRNTITLHVPVIDFCDGRIEVALFLEQLMYWTTRSESGWVSKSAKEWWDECRISKYDIEQAMKLFAIPNDKRESGKMPCIETEIKKFNGAPTIRYKIDMTKLTEFWTEYIENIPNGFIKISKSDLRKSANPSEKISKSLTETTTETTTEKNMASPVSLKKPTFTSLEKSEMPIEWQVAASEQPVILQDTKFAEEREMMDIANLIDFQCSGAGALAFAFMEQRGILFTQNDIKKERKFARQMLESKPNQVKPEHVKLAVMKLTTDRIAEGKEPLTCVSLGSVLKTAISLANPVEMPEDGNIPNNPAAENDGWGGFEE